MRRPLRYLLAICLGIALVIGASLAGGWLLLDTETGRAWLGQEISRLLSVPGRTVRISGITGAVSSQLRIASFEDADDSGTWFSTQ